MSRSVIPTRADPAHTLPGLALALAGTLSSTAPLAQTAALPDTELAPIVVSASRADTRLADMPLSTTVVSREAIERSPARTLDQLLREVPGLNMTGAPYQVTDPTGNQARMRGLSNYKVLVLLDGIPIHDPFYGTVQWNKVPLSSVERIEVIRGGSSSLWGNLAMTGVINIVSRRPVDLGGEIDMSRGDMNTDRLAIMKNLAAGPAFGLRLSGSIAHTDGYQTTPAAFLANLPGKIRTPADEKNLQVDATFRPTAGIDGFLRMGYHDIAQEIGGYAWGKNQQRSPDLAGGLSARLDERSTAELRAWRQLVAFEKYNGAGCYLQGNATCNTTTPSATVVQYANSRDWNTYRESGGSVQVSHRLSGVFESAQAGIDHRDISGEDAASTWNTPTSVDTNSAALNRTSYGQGRQSMTGLFTQLKARPLDPLQLTLNLRYDTWSNTEGVSTLVKYTAGVPGATQGGALDSTHKSSINPALAMRWDLTEETALRAAAYHAFRAPGLNNLYRSYSSTSSITIANPGLAPETLTGSEIGLDWRGTRSSASATAFSQNIRDMIATYKVTGTPPASVAAICGNVLPGNCPATVNFYTNGQDARSQGLELIGRHALSDSLFLDASYTFSDTRYTRTSTGDPTGVQLGAIPAHVGTLGAGWNPDSRWKTHAQLRYTSGMYLDVNRTLPQPAIATVNLSIAYGLQRDLDLYGSVVNLFNTHYADNATTSAASQTLGMPRAGNVGLRWRFR
jgi:iron complex outermembrane receptor protein